MIAYFLSASKCAGMLFPIGMYPIIQRVSFPMKLSALSILLGVVEIIILTLLGLFFYLV